MRTVLGAAALATAVMVFAACGWVVRPAASSPAPTGAMERVQVYYARANGEPIAVPVLVPPATTIASRIQRRFAALIEAPGAGPNGSFNLLAGSGIQIDAISTDRDLATIDFLVMTDDWGLRDAAEVRAFVQQVVFTATDESSIYKVLLTRDHGRPALIGVSDVITTYHSPLTRELVGPIVYPEHAVVYFARDGQPPLAVFLPGAGTGATAEERIRSRLTALESGPGIVLPDAYNSVRGANATVHAVQVRGDLAIIDYLVPGDDWGVNGSARVASFVEQLVYTASEEPGITRVLITQNAGHTAVVGSEGVIIDHPATRVDLPLR